MWYVVVEFFEESQTGVSRKRDKKGLREVQSLKCPEKGKTHKE